VIFDLLSVPGFPGSFGTPTVTCTTDDRVVVQMDEHAAIELAKREIDERGMFSASESSVTAQEQVDAWVVTFAPREPDSSRIEDLVIGGPGARVTVRKSDGSTSVVYSQ
jgi:hypothetical protein